MTAIAFTVAGKPAPQGSKNAFRTKAGGVAIVESSKGLGSWRERVALAAHAAMHGQPMMTGPVHLLVQFILPRPAATPKTKPTPPATCAPDLDKLCRGICDALQGVCMHSDSQIVTLVATKRRAELDEPFIGASIHLRTEKARP